MELDYQSMMVGIANSIRARAPRVSGNLAMNVKAYATGSGDEIGVISIEVPYASFVNYGYLTHPNSSKLRKDYLFVENAIRNELKILVSKYGGYIK